MCVYLCAVCEGVAQVLVEPRDQPEDFFSRVSGRASSSKQCACSLHLQQHPDQLLRCLVQRTTAGNSTQRSTQQQEQEQGQSSAVSPLSITLVR